MKYQNYITEIKNRLKVLTVNYLTTLFVSYYYKDLLLNFLLNVVSNKTLKYKTYFIFTNVYEIIENHLLICFFTTNVTCLVLFAYQLLTFFASAFYYREFFNTRKFLARSAFLLISSIFLSLNLTAPLIWEFFLKFNDVNNVINSYNIELFFEAKLSDYISVLKTTINLSFLTLLFLFVSFILINTVKNYKLKVIRKLFYFFFVITATLITPPEVTLQILLSCFLICCYELLIIIKEYRRLINYAGNQLKLIKIPIVRAK